MTNLSWVKRVLPIVLYDTSLIRSRHQTPISYYECIAKLIEPRGLLTPHLRIPYACRICFCEFCTHSYRGWAAVVHIRDGIYFFLYFLLFFCCRCWIWPPGVATPGSRSRRSCHTATSPLQTYLSRRSRSLSDGPRAWPTPSVR